MPTAWSMGRLEKRHFPFSRKTSIPNCQQTNDCYVKPPSFEIGFGLKFILPTWSRKPRLV